jgi:hypothetical protein
MKENMKYLSFCVWLISVNIISSILSIFAINDRIHSFCGWIIFHCIYEPHIFFQIIFNFFVVLGGDTLCHLQKFLQYIKYIILELTSPLHHSWNSFNSYHFLHLHTSVCYTVFALYSPPPPSHWYQPHPRQNLFCPPVLLFCKRKKNDIFVCLR